MWTTYWWGIEEDENGDLCGEEFFTELENADYIDHLIYVQELFPDVKVKSYGKVSEMEAEMMGLDTYQKGGIKMTWEKDQIIIVVMSFVGLFIYACMR